MHLYVNFVPTRSTNHIMTCTCSQTNYATSQLTRPFNSLPIYIIHFIADWSLLNGVGSLFGIMEKNISVSIFGFVYKLEERRSRRSSVTMLPSYREHLVKFESIFLPLSVIFRGEIRINIYRPTCAFTQIIHLHFASPFHHWKCSHFHSHWLWYHWIKSWYSKIGQHTIIAVYN